MLYLAVFAMLAFGYPVAYTTTPPFNECPAIGSNTSCAILVIINPGGSLTILQDNTQGPYDGSDDTLVGVLNNSGTTVPSITLSSSTLSPFGFESDGICIYTFVGSGYCSGAYYKTDPGDYAGPANTFSNISASGSTGTVVFTGGLAPGAATYFSLESSLTASSLSGGLGGVPAPASLILVMTGLAGALLFHFWRNSKNGVAV
jgi:hypothetical protein